MSLPAATDLPAPAMPAPPAGRARMPRRRFATARAVASLMLREMASSYGRSPGGYLWAVLEPVAGIALLTLVFSAMFRAPALGSSFATFYATGLLPFILFTDVQNKVAQSLNYSRPLLAYPTVTFIDAIAARFLLNLMTQIMVSVMVIYGCMVLFPDEARPELTIVFETWAMAALFGLATGTMNCFLFTRFPMMVQIWGIIMRPMFIISGIMFIYDAIPAAYQGYLWWNPLIHIVGWARKGFYSTYDADYASPLYVVIVSLILLVFGLLFLRRYHRDLLTR